MLSMIRSNSLGSFIVAWLVVAQQNARAWQPQPPPQPWHSSLSLLSHNQLGRDVVDNGQEEEALIHRRTVFQQLGSVVGGFLVVAGVPVPPPPARADGEATSETTGGLFTRQTDKFAYEFLPPSNFGAGNKPLKTHLDEINFKSLDVPGYQFGITVDPVRIRSLRDFGSPEEVAARVVLAEVNRDGVFEVQLMEDPVAAPNDAYYRLNYLSSGKRGTKRFVTKFYIQNQMLYALTAQCKEPDFDSRRDEILAAAESFRVL